MARLLGIDLGTTSVSALLLDSERRSILAVSSRGHEAAVPGLAAGRHEHDPSRVLRAIGLVLSDIASAGGGHVVRADALTVTGHMHGFIALDAGFTPAGNFVTWEDRRSLEPEPSGTPRLTAVKRIIEETAADEGVSAASGYASATLYAMVQTGELPARTRWVVSVQDWITGWLCGWAARRPVTDPSCAHSTGLYLPRRGEWNRAALERIGITEELMPEIRGTGSEAGSVSTTASVPLSSGTPVMVGLGDNQASFLGAVRDPGETVLLNVGTGSQVSVTTEEFRPVPGLDLRPYIDGRFLLVGAPLCGGRAFSLLADCVQEIIRVIGKTDVGRDELYRRLVAAADLDTAVKCSVAFAGTRDDPDERGYIANIGESGLRIADVAGGMLNGIAAELHGLYGRCGLRRTVAVGSGNGVRRNPRLRESLSRSFGMPLRVPLHTEEASLGAALVAGVGVGAFSCYASAAGSVEYEP